MRSSLGGSGLAGAGGGDAGGEAAQHELADEVLGGVAGDVEEAVADGEAEAARGGGVVGVGDGSGGEAAEDVGVVGLELAVVAARDDGRLEGVERRARTVPEPL